MPNQTLKFYKRNNKKLSEQYNSVSFESVHKDWLEYLPKKNELILDIGAGSGRDAVWLSNNGYHVIAVEPVTEFFEKFQSNERLVHQNNKIDWIVDSLPELYQLEKHSKQISLILLSAVWMHLTPQERTKSFHRFAKLNTQNGLLVISLRYGESPDERLMYPVSSDEIKSLAIQYHYRVICIKKSDDKLSRSGVLWETLVLEKLL